jgi:hypothetical protein
VSKFKKSVSLGNLCKISAALPTQNSATTANKSNTSVAFTTTTNEHRHSTPSLAASGISSGLPNNNRPPPPQLPIQSLNLADKDKLLAFEQRTAANPKPNGNLNSLIP